MPATDTDHVSLGSRPLCASHVDGAPHPVVLEVDQQRADNPMHSRRHSAKVHARR